MTEVETEIDQESKLSKTVKKHEPNLWAAYQDMAKLVGGDVAITRKLSDAWRLLFDLKGVLKREDDE